MSQKLDGEDRLATVLPPVHEAWLPREHSLHRPRHGTSQRSALIAAVVFFCLPFVLFVAGERPAEMENRKPAEFPSLAQGWGFFAGLPAWASDNLPLRDWAIKTNVDVSESIFGEPPNFTVPKPATGPAVPAPPHEQNPTTLDQGGDGFPTVIVGKDGWMYLGSDTRGKCKPKQQLDQVMANLKSLGDAARKSGRTFVLVVAPDKTTMVPEHLPASYAGRSCADAFTPEFWRRANDDLGIVDLRDPLRRESERIRTPVYFSQDSHWTFAGGLTMIREIVERIQPGLSERWKISDGNEWSGPAGLPPLIGKTGEAKARVYRLGPDGGADRTQWVNSDFNKPVFLESRPIGGMVRGSTAFLADSFTQFASPYIGAVFEKVSITHVGQLATESDAIAARLVQAKTIVVEVVERHLSTGFSPISDPAVVATLSNAFAANPVG